MSLSAKSPNTVLANALIRTIDQLRPRLIGAKPSRIDFIVGTQINGAPHVGTHITQVAAFLLAREARNYFSIDTRVVFGALDNAPKSIELDPESFHSYQTTYRHALGYEKVSSLVDKYYKRFFDELSERTAVEYCLELYSDQQAQKGFRKTFLATLAQHDRLAWCISPSNGIAHVRFPCPVCHKGEKRGERTRLLDLSPTRAVFEAVCFDHGAYTAIVTEDSSDYIDLNTLYRNIVKEAQCADDVDALAVIVKGGDWAFACQLVDWGLGILGYTSNQCPVRIYTPQVVTETGAKLSKSLIGRKEMHVVEELAWVLDPNHADLDFDDYLDSLMLLVSEMIQNPKHFYRSYSYQEIVRLINEQSQEKKMEQRARIMRIYRKYYDMIASGGKTVEVRVAYSSMKQIGAGQLLRFVSQTDSTLTRVVAVRTYATFDELFAHEDAEKIGPGVPTDRQIEEVKKIFPPNKEALGVLAIEIERV